MTDAEESDSSVSNELHGKLQLVCDDDRAYDALEKQEEIVGWIIEDCRKKVIEEDKKLPITVSDMIRLFQFQREIEKQRGPVGVIEIRWIDQEVDNRP